jgi:hypothetical protein
MKMILFSLLLLTVASPLLAYNPVVAEPPEAYDVIKIEGDPYIERSYLGDLEEFPDMYELTTDVAIKLKVELKQRSTKKAVPFGLIMVRQNNDDGGVTEIIRQNQPLTDWKENRNTMLGITFLGSEVIEKDIVPGTYRIEISTPDNKGPYMLTVGEEPVSSGYFKALLQIAKTQYHFGATPFGLLASSYVHYTLGIIIVLYGIYRTSKYRKQ